jgi:hypothetical protein
MITALRAILGTTSNENFTVIRLNGTEAYRNREILKQYFSRFPIIIYIVVGDVLLVKFEEMDAVVLEGVCTAY